MSESTQGKKFGTFLGVYTPSILTILGLIMYLRFGWVVGNIGLTMTIATVLLASSITFITGLSASAIATNIQVGVGGEYYLVSRSLGLEPGGAIGFPLYLCRTLSVTFYCFGLAEALLILWPADWGEVPSYGVQLFAAILIILVTLLSGKSAALALKAQIPIMILVGLSILALAIGVLTNEMHPPLNVATYSTAPEGYWYVFAVFFPAVTGFTAGIGMSGDLKDPRKSIPVGTLGAVISGIIIYLIIPLLLSVTALLALEDLTNPEAGLETWTKVALFGGILIYPAVWGAILSSAFGSILGGPRVLQALSMDGLAPKFLSKLSKTGQPTIATWVSGAIALVAVLLGGLNTVAQFVSVLFLTLYVAVNISAALETLVAEPSYRPQIKVPWYISILGALGAIGVMYLISPLACLLALGLEVLLLVWLRSRSLEQRWGDVVAGFWINFARYSLLQLDKRKIHARNWRPLMLLFINDVHKRIDIIKLAAALGQNRGVVTIAKLLFQKEDSVAPQKRLEMELDMAAELRAHGVDAFTEVHTSKGLHAGIHNVSKAHGIADMRTNTVIFGWSETHEGRIAQLKLIPDIRENGKNLMLVKINQPLPEDGKIIDIWWGGQENNGDLMLLLAHLLTLNNRWKKSVINIRSMVQNKEEQIKMTHGIEQILPKARIQANVMIEVSEVPFLNFIRQKSSEADLVFLGLARKFIGDVESRVKSINLLSERLKIVVFVQNNQSIRAVPKLLDLDD
jgi:amino acid transporter